MRIRTIRALSDFLTDWLGRENLPGVCPVCDHSPLSPDICKDNTALRTTVAVFLRTAEKKHLLSLQKEKKEPQKPPVAVVELPQHTPDTVAAVQSSLQIILPETKVLQVQEAATDSVNLEAPLDGLQNTQPTQVVEGQAQVYDFPVTLFEPNSSTDFCTV